MKDSRGDGEFPAGRGDFLLEIGCEEIPARMIGEALGDLCARVTGILDAAALSHDPPRPLGTPRRLSVLVAGVAMRQEDRVEEVTGPPVKAAFGRDGQPTQAAIAFARRVGADLSALRTVSTSKGDYLAARRAVAGRSASEILSESLPAAIAEMTFPKMMRWGPAGQPVRRFVRPVHWIVAMLGEQVVPFELFGVQTGCLTDGHRVLGQRQVRLPSAAAYEEALLSQGVVVDRAARRRTLAERLTELASSEGLRPLEDPDLLTEVADLVEHPGAVLGSFPGEFLALPREILVTALRHHQKAFSTERDGHLSNHFLCVADLESDPQGHVARGNEWVVVGRLEDARFFVTEDRKVPLAARREKLANVTFHAKAGSYLDKSDRIEAISAALAGRLSGAGLSVRGSALTRAAGVCKCDLTTGLVGEFPELQGVAGGIYIRAEAAGWDEADREAAGAAVGEHYRPAGSTDSLPRTLEARLLSLADKLDTLLALGRCIGLPKGSKDPFALRRAAYGAVRIATEGALPLRLREDLLGSAWPVVEARVARGAEGAGLEEILGFLLDRFQFWLKEKKSARYDTVSAVFLAAGGSGAHSTLPRIAEKVVALERLRELPDIAALIEMHKRCRNIDEQARQVDSGGVLETALKEDPEEAPALDDLARRLSEAEREIGRLMARDEFEDGMQRLAALRPALSRFFDHVLVMHPDPRQRGGRLDLVRKTGALIEEVADLKQIAISRQEMHDLLARLGTQAGP